MRAKILSASAGSGKTYRLAYKFVHDTIKHYNEKPYLYRAILAVTFTNKATAEMKNRIIKEFDELITNSVNSNYMADLKRDLSLGEEEIIKRAKAILSKILHDYSRFTILTIDKFFQRILRAFIKELGIDINYNLELEGSTLLSRSTDSLIDDIAHNEELQNWIMEFAQENIDDNGKWDIREKIHEIGKELFKEQSKQSIENALPKSELLDTIRQVEKRCNIKKREIAALGQKGVEIMQQAGVEPSDFSGANRSFAFKFAECANGKTPSLTDTVRQRAESLDGWITKGKKDTPKALAAESAAIKLQPILAQIIDIYDSYSHLDYSLSLVKKTFRSFALLQDVYEKMGHICNEEGIMLLSETKYILSQFINNNDAPFIYEKTGNRFERFMIDEFQDTSSREWANFVPLLQNAMSQSEDNAVLIVGDVKQSIYRWRGGDWRILQQGVSNALGEADTELEVLANNYRSLPCIVGFNNMAVERTVAMDNTNLNQMLADAIDDGSLSENCGTELKDILVSAYKDHTQIAKSNSKQEGYVRVERYEEEPPLIDCIESVVARGYSYGDIMILHRSKNDITKTANILLEYKQKNNAFNIMTQESLIIGKAPISCFVIALLQLSQNPNDAISCALVNDYLKRPYDQPLSQEEVELLSDISQFTPEQAFDKIVMHYDLSSHIEEIAYLQALHEMIVTYCASKIADIQLFIKYWKETGADKSLAVEQSDSTIELMTIHKAKGLEKKIVIIPYCNWPLSPQSNSIVWADTSNESSGLSKIGRMPIEYKSDMGKSVYGDDYYRELVYSHVDNINILYVALTRACEELYIYIPNKSKGKQREENTSKKNKKSGDSTPKYIGLLLWEALTEGSTDTECNRLEYGTVAELAHKADADTNGPTKETSTDKKRRPEPKNVLIKDYPSNDCEVKLSLPSLRYFEEQSDSIASLEVGILMHKILSEADNTEKIKEKIRVATEAGSISKEQAESLDNIIEREFENPIIKEWFNGNWDMVRCESDIIPGQQFNTHDNKPVGTLRPDRIMIKGDRVVVVDYKFGNITSKSHIKQVSRYMSLMREMGYKQIEGYIWYLTRSEIVQIES